MANISYTLFPAIFNMSVTASVAIIAIILFKLFFWLFRISFKKIPATIFYVMWIVVLFRLLCPVSISSDLSYFSRFDSPVAHTGTNTSVLEFIPNDIVHTEYPSVDLPVDFADHLINFFLPKGEEQLRADPLEAPVAIATNIWFFGIFGMAVYGIYSHTKLKKQLVGSLKVRDNIYICDYISAPFVTGIIKPKIYLPSALGEKESIYIILHEQQHIKRFDHIFKLLAFIALTIHWFNPLVWLAYELAMQDMEMSCDEAVIKKLGEDIRSAYSQSLLNFSTGRHIFAGAPLAFGEGDIKVRIKNLYSPAKSTIINTVFVALLATVLIFTLAINPDTNKGQIIYNGMLYQQTGNPASSLPKGSTHVANLLYTEDWYWENDLYWELSSSNIKSEYLNMPIFQHKDIPDTIFLTCGGDGWMPLKAVSMDYSTTDIWIEPKQNGKGIEYTAKLNSDVKECGIVEDIYLQGELYSSRVVIYNDSVSADENYTDYGSFDYNVHFSEEGGIYEMEFVFRHNEYVTSTSTVALPREKYTGAGSQPSFMTAYNYKKNNHHYKMLANDSFDLLTISFSTRDNGGIFTNFEAEYAAEDADMRNDTVIIYRFVTSSSSLRE